MKKKLSLYMNLLLATVMGLSLTACGSDDVTGGQPDETDYTSEVIICDTTSISAEDMAKQLFGAEEGDKTVDSLREEYMKEIHEREQELANEKGVNGLYMGFKTCTFKYWSKDPFGKPILLSGMVSWAQFWAFGWWDLNPDNIFLMEHYTIMSDDERPTKKHTTEQLALGDNLLIMPDYIGYGETKDMVHPYLNHEVCAINSIDALEAGCKVFEKMKDRGTKMEDDWKLYVLGASQGGGNALAVHKYLDTHLDLANKWRFDYSYCCAGPYSPSATMDFYYLVGNLTYPVILPIVIKSMLYCYPDIMGKWKEEDFYSDEYLKVKDEMDKLFAAKQLNSTDLIAKLKELLGKDNITVNDLLSKEALNKNSEMTKALYECLDKNDLTKGWTPVHKIKLYHSQIDDIVPYTNAQALVGQFGEDKVKLFNSYWAGHVNTCLKWYGTLATNNW